MANMAMQRRPDRSLGGHIFCVALWTFQFIFAIVISILYGIDLHHASETRARAHPSWVFAEVAAALSALTCVAHFFVLVKKPTWRLWDFVLAVLWAACSGYFATLFWREGEVQKDSGFTTSEERMKAAIWVDLFSMLLWFASAFHGCVSCIGGRWVRRTTGKPSVALRSEGQMDQNGKGEHRSELPTYGELFERDAQDSERDSVKSGSYGTSDGEAKGKRLLLRQGDGHAI